jgi:hypothetical protein
MYQAVSTRARLDAIVRQLVLWDKLASIVDQHVQMTEAVLELHSTAVH